jgi:hypothetical protein
MQNAQQEWEHWMRRVEYLSIEADEAHRCGDKQTAKIMAQGVGTALDMADHWQQKMRNENDKATPTPLDC